MKILIVDDAPQRYQSLITDAIGLGMSRDDFKFCSCTNDARDALEANVFDLLVCDIIIPLWPDSNAEMQNCIDLLEEVVSGADLHKPRRIVGISADSHAAITASPVFSRNVWTVLEYSESNDAWLSQLRNCITYLLDVRSSSEPRSYGVDLAVVCALPNPELSQVLALDWDFSPAKPLDDITFIHEGSFKSNGRKRRVVAASAQMMGMVSSSLLVRSVIEKLRPRLIVMTGICAGVKGEVNLGDVIFADSSWDWQNGKYVREKDGDPEFRTGAHHLGPSASARSHMDQLSRDPTFLAVLSSNGPDTAPHLTKVVIAPMASGSAVIADEAIVAEIRSQSRKVAGIEMEGYGVFAAGDACDTPRPSVMVIKGVCDFADPHKSDDIQRYAAYASATVTKEFVERFFDRIVA